MKSLKESLTGNNVGINSKQQILDFILTNYSNGDINKPLS